MSSVKIDQRSFWKGLFTQQMQHTQGFAGYNHTNIMCHLKHNLYMYLLFIEFINP